MGKVIRVPSELSIESIEGLLTELSETAEPFDLLLPTELKSSQFGRRVALAQLILTWASRRDGRLRIHATAGQDYRSLVENLLKYDHGVVAIGAAESVVDRTGKTDLVQTSSALLRARLGEMDTVAGATRGAKVFFAVADDTRLFPKALYDSPPSAFGEHTIRPLMGFNGVMSQALSRLAEGPKPFQPTQLLTAQLGRTLFELFRNTHDWGRSTADGARIKRSVRGFKLELYYNQHAKHVEMVSNEEPLRAYVDRPEHRGPDRRSRFIELAVFDSGPGLASRALRKVGGSRITPQVEYAAVVNCLRKHFTSSAVVGRGQGLHDVLLMLDELKAFVRIRAGRSALFRDFASMPYRPERKGEPYLYCWSGDKKHSTWFAPVVGTSFTILFPVRYA